MQIITLSNQKGGVGKTTTASVLASGLIIQNYKDLAIDLDPQSNFSLSCGINVLECENTIYNVFRGEVNINDVIIPTSLGYDVITGGLQLAMADMEFTKVGRENLLTKALKKLNNSYDYIIIDTPPTLGILTANALMASNGLIVPMSADMYSLQGLSQINSFLMDIRENGNSEIRLLGLLITKFKGRENLSKSIVEEIESIASKLNTKVFSSKIRESVAIRENVAVQGNIFYESPKANATIDYKNFIDELLKDLEA